MQFKFKHSKISFNVKTTAEAGFTIAFTFNEEAATNYQELTNNDPSLLITDLTAAGALTHHGQCILVSLGSRDKFNFAALASVAASLAKFVAAHKIAEINLLLTNQVADKLGVSFAEVVEKLLVDFGHGLYYFDEFKSEKAKLALEKVHVIASVDLSRALSNALAILEGLFLVKDLANNPANVATPSYLAEIAAAFTKLNKNVSAEIFDEKEIKKLGMNTFLAVAKGSKEEPRFIKLEYKGGKKSAKPIVLVGKGITFDSGGISLKPGANMDEMKYDMCGAATVLGVFASVVRLNLAVNLIVLVPSCENMPSGNALKPGDIIKSLSGKTIEILNTDAEGRLILCDALTYAKQFDPAWVIDVATLTGACIIALGNVASGLYANDDELARTIEDAATTANDKVWRLPLYEEYSALLKGTHADLQNIGGWGGKAGSVTAACFLKEFVDYKWAHLDIAGTAWVGEAKATGRPFKLLVELIRNQANSK
jgi:leucyl aminopeptidase